MFATDKTVLNRRVFGIAAAATLAASGGLLGRPAFAQAPAAPRGPYTLPPLLYDHAALEPAIDRETMMLHHGKHHQAYVDGLNRALVDHPQLQNLAVEDLLIRLNEVPEAIRTTVRNQGGGHANHQMFWKIMRPGGSPMPDHLKRQIDLDFGSLDEMKAKFEDAATKHFGSGWAFVVLNPQSKKLEILTLPNQDSVLPLGKPALFGNDLWEHAYYLKYRNQRPAYLKAWWDVVHWAEVGERLTAFQQPNAGLTGSIRR